MFALLLIWKSIIIYYNAFEFYWNLEREYRVYLVHLAHCCFCCSESFRPTPAVPSVSSHRCLREYHQADRRRPEGRNYLLYAGTTHYAADIAHASADGDGSRRVYARAWIPEIRKTIIPPPLITINIRHTDTI